MTHAQDMDGAKALELPASPRDRTEPVAWLVIGFVAGFAAF